MKKYHIKTFRALLAAFIISAVYQFYRFKVGEVPQVDQFGMTQIIAYAIMIALAATVLVNKMWTDVLMIIYCSFLYLIAFIYYFPEVYPLRTNGFWDVAEAVVYMALILVAAICSIFSIKSRRSYLYKIQN